MNDELALRRQVCFALYAASRSVINLYRPVLDDLGVTYPQYLVLLVLGERGPLSVKDLGAALRLDSGTLSPLLKRMEVVGTVTRRRRTDDERSVLVELTPEGHALRERAKDVPGRVAQTTGIPVAELAELRETLTRLTAALDAAAYVSTVD
jgi:MarR family transcriptional regulator, organic hydroperoxide resistance regulator